LWKISEKPKSSTKRRDEMKKNYVYCGNYRKNQKFPQKEVRQLKKVMFSGKYRKIRKFPHTID
jgi:hypothetical protein